MQAYRKTEMTVGVFVFIGLVAIAWLAIKVGQIGGIGASGYTLTANFKDAGGVRKGSDIMLAGVVIGRVDDVVLTDNDHATMILRINDGVEITEDAFASVRTKGIIGDRYIRISQGMEETPLEAGSEIEETESAINIEDLISKYIFSGKE
ncbi:phospholipid/cholesterol/gamma-HCH transport system substrate-binding protein [Mariprofundus ferrinatatus]|uniref:Phospholipid/cholesterol/gamma-HCH transport system substrate-binding protein n=1 Tax=Mariprofundus ferrinatatus TaxID=1921087 RepID=A0A2K8L669_9PROT|nr:outer membrane lipid asymmetry maintenance protein MlaD [Mariprofundus ferrinatatus]ATX82815.1 phospholipid/cholesterol/gamma-HCH transport system substrate-binding protein [Mariprofundus ferrinatatus]